MGKLSLLAGDHAHTALLFSICVDNGAGMRLNLRGHAHGSFIFKTSVITLYTTKQECCVWLEATSQFDYKETNK